MAYEEQSGELSEDACENIGFQIAEIDGLLLENKKYNATNLAMADIRVMTYWEYIEGKCDFDELIKSLKNMREKFSLDDNKPCLCCSGELYKDSCKKKINIKDERIFKNI